MKYDILLMTYGLVTTSIWRTAVKGFCLFQENMCDFVQFTLLYIPSLKRERTNSYVCKKWNVTDAGFYMTWNGAAKTYKNIHCNGEMSRNYKVLISHI